MDFNNYQQQALKTAIYPNQGKNLVYTVLGLTEEIGEALEKSQNKDSVGLLKELGDILWYISCCASELKVELNQIHSLRTLIVAKPERDLFLDLFHQGAIISGRTKKIIRDNNGQIPEDKKQTICQALAHCLLLLNLIAQNEQSSLEEIAKLNIEKLQERFKIGTLKGDGDNR